MTASIAAIHVAKKQLGLDEDTYRAKLEIITGKASTKSMTEAERERVLQVFRKEGFQPKSNRRADGRLKISGKYAGKLQALWISAWNLGIVQNRDDGALVKFAERQTGIEHVRFLKNAADARKTVEALKGWIARVGGVDWSDAEIMSDYARADGFKIAWAQWLKLGGNANAYSVGEFHALVLQLTDTTVELCDRRDWQTVMNELGKRIRGRKAGA
ncbi:regulatory protein GemA [Rhizobium ruizarguesonis]|uniref:gp16 family protein n=1 Tax=Rhizobium ruizarguesonis TaxID=2081791 RepID=UPI0010321094|nr:regulatory protein GemA [Rhizobium ruizarguesonis]TBA43813.1 regulatory protein GemA [Rhizobium ruizarguesonis]TBB98737.1 regulatory protein GemA [Rhizobium ruizarguesonis]